MIPLSYQHQHSDGVSLPSARCRHLRLQVHCDETVLGLTVSTPLSMNSNQCLFREPSPAVLEGGEVSTGSQKRADINPSWPCPPLRILTIHMNTAQRSSRRNNVATRPGTARRRRGRPREPDRCAPDDQLRHAGADVDAMYHVLVHQGRAEVQNGNADVFCR